MRLSLYHHAAGVETGPGVRVVYDADLPKSQRATVSLEAPIEPE